MNNQNCIHWTARLTLAFIFIWHGLVPKILLTDVLEQQMIAASPFPLPFDAQNNQETAEPWSPRQSEYGLPEQMWSTMINLLTEIKQGLIVQGGGKPKAEKPFPVPRTEVDRLIEAAENDWVTEFLEELGFDASDI